MRTKIQQMKKMLFFLFTSLPLYLSLASCGETEKEYDATGTFEATEVTVSAEQTGRLMTFDVTEGTKIEMGQQVGLIDTVQLTLKARQLGATKESIANQRPDMQKQIAATQQQIRKAEQEVQRFQQLVKEQAANRKQLEDAQNQVQVLKRQLAARQSTISTTTASLNSQMGATDIQRLQVMDQLAKCHIIAPFSGTVLEKYAEPGEFATTGRPLFKLADTEEMFLRAYITSVQLSKVKIGQQVKVFADYGDDTKHEYKGTVVWISSRAEFTPKSILTDDERADQVYAVKIRVKNDGYIKIGMYGEVKI